MIKIWGKESECHEKLRKGLSTRGAGLVMTILFMVWLGSPWHGPIGMKPHLSFTITTYDIFKGAMTSSPPPFLCDGIFGIRSDSCELWVRNCGIRSGLLFRFMCILAYLGTLRKTISSLRCPREWRIGEWAASLKGIDSVFFWHPHSCLIFFEIIFLLCIIEKRQESHLIFCFPYIGTFS